MMDYQGFGMSTGTPTEDGMIEDVKGAVKWLEERGLEQDRFVMYGYSLGSAPATAVSANNEILMPSKLIHFSYKLCTADNKKFSEFSKVNILKIRALAILLRTAGKETTTKGLKGSQNLQEKLKEKLACLAAEEKSFQGMLLHDFGFNSMINHFSLC